MNICWVTLVREGCLLYNRWIFGKFPKRGGGVISDLKNFVAKFLALETTIFPEKGAGGGGQRSFGNFGTDGLPLQRFEVWSTVVGILPFDSSFSILFFVAQAQKSITALSQYPGLVQVWEKACRDLMCHPLTCIPPGTGCETDTAINPCWQDPRMVGCGIWCKKNFVFNCWKNATQEENGWETSDLAQWLAVHIA